MERSLKHSLEHSTEHTQILQNKSEQTEALQNKIEYFRAQAEQYHFTREYSKAMEFYVRAGILGDRDSIIEVCEKLRSGYGMTHNYNELFRCMLVGAERYGIPEAMVELARCYQSAIGTVRNAGKAKEWLQRAGMGLETEEEEFSF